MEALAVPVIKCFQSIAPFLVKLGVQLETLAVAIGGLHAAAVAKEDLDLVAVVTLAEDFGFSVDAG